jgi:hypothetical protein
MKITAIILLGLILLLIVAAVVQRPRQIQAEAIIEASTAEVWKVLADNENWHTWNPAMIESSGKLEPGQRLRNTMAIDGAQFTFKPKVLSVTENREFSWVGHLLIPGIFDGKHEFLLEELGPEQVKLIEKETFSGLLSTLLLKQIGQQTLQAWRAAHQALKERVEQQANGLD